MTARAVPKWTNNEWEGQFMTCFNKSKECTSFIIGL